MKEIKTNYREGRYTYPISNGENREGWTMKLQNSCSESPKEMYERLIEAGYTKISFYEVTTRIKGLHNIIAYCKRG